LGTAYHGWQAQDNAPSVQVTIEDALQTVLRKPCPIVGSGRTDTGVHALQQYFHLDTHAAIDHHHLKYQLNAVLPDDISINSIRQVRDDVHARYDAIWRRYQYRICREKDPFEYQKAYLFYKPLDIDNMNEAASLLVGKQNFMAFSKVKTNVNHFFCNVYEARWEEKDHLLVFNIRANRFLRGMVRALTGTLLMIGEGKLNLADFTAILDSLDRRKAGPSVVPHGLFLSEIYYPDEVFIDSE
jgi:tRNA pseudouridine38-40 synthase